jgi:hypothetical protein
VISHAVGGRSGLTRVSTIIRVPHTPPAIALDVDGRGVFHPRPMVLDPLEDRPHDVRRRVDNDGHGDVRQRATL